jgi:signal peptidase II
MLYAIVAALILILDQGLKYWTVQNLALNEGTAVLIPGILQLTHVRNTGGAFGLFPGGRWLFLALLAVFCAAVVYMLAKKLIGGSFGRWMAVLVMAGALGNGIDRAIYGYVVDMIEFEFVGWFPVCNVADCFITVCGILFCLYVLFYRRPEPAGGRSAKQAGRPAGRPGAARRPAPPRDSSSASFENPFEETKKGGDIYDLGRPNAAPRAEQAPVHRKAPSVPEPNRVVTAAPARTGAAPAPEKPATDDEFSLESILAEFGSK